MMLLSDAASSTNVPVSFSSVMTADTRVRGSNMNGSEKFFRGMDAQAPDPHRLRISTHNVPLPLLPSVE